jgi:outer membrane beta-barrel protein
MDTRFQHVLLRAKALTLAAALVFAPAVFADEGEGSGKTDISDINNEVIELGIFFGVLNVEDFGSEFLQLPGASLTFRASEDFFVQYNYLQVDVSPSSYEENQGNLLEGDDRTFRHYDLLIGYNLFQGEFFPSPPQAKLSTLYIVAGVGDTEFGGESSLTYTVGIGYQVALTRRLGVHFDFRDYIYQSSLVSDEERMVHATQISSGIKFMF